MQKWMVELLGCLPSSVSREICSTLIKDTAVKVDECIEGAGIPEGWGEVIDKVNLLQHALGLRLISEVIKPTEAEEDGEKDG